MHGVTPKLGSALMLAAIGVACSGEPTRVEQPRASLLSQKDPAMTFRSPADWSYHPKKEAALNARHEIEPGKVVFAGGRGERWLVDEKSGKVRAAARLAPEDIVAILRPEGGGWLFLGETGTTYEADEPLGAFTRSSAPLDPLVRLDATNAAVLGVRSDGTLARSEGSSAVWQRVGPENTRFVAVALVDDGKGLALAVPESLFETGDHGATWSRMGVATFGATGLEKDDEAGIVVQSALGRKQWKPGDGDAFVDLSRAVSRSKYELGEPPPRGPDAAALASGRAVVVSGHYLEVTRERDGDRHWELLVGAVGEELTRRSLDIDDECRAAKIASLGRYVYVACSIEEDRHGDIARFYRSNDAAKSFDLEPYAVSARFEQLRLAVGVDGQLLVTGVCAELSRGCKPEGVFHRRRALPPRADPNDKKKKKKNPKKQKKKKRGLELGRSAIPALSGVASAVAYSTDGRTAYVVGRRTTHKRGGLAIYLSKDGGKTFQAREIDTGTRGKSSAPTVVGVTPSDDGTISLVLQSGQEYRLVVADDDGRQMALSSAPVAGAVVGAVGTRALALIPHTAEAWESLDGGATWDAIGQLPMALCKAPSETRCRVQVACHVGGCIVGEELSRVGWRGQADDDLGLLAPPERSRRVFFDRKLRTSISCTVDEAPWQRLDGVSEVPDASDAAIGKVAWFASSVDPVRASVTMHHAFGGRRPRVDSIVLMAPSARPESVAFTYRPQLEGGVALRYELPKSTGAPIRNAEVVWDDLVEGKVGRATVADAGPWDPSDADRSAHGASAAKPHLLSIAPGGVHVRIHGRAGNAQTTHFVDGRRLSSIPSLSWPLRECRSSPNELTRVDGVSVPFCRARNRAALLRARRDGSSWQFDALTVGLAKPADFGLVSVVDMAYVGSQPGLTASFVDEFGRGTSQFYRFRATGDVLSNGIELPLLSATGNPPRACNKNERAKTPRLRVAYHAGARHPVIITGVTEPLRVMLTERTVLQGTRKRPCVSAVDAVSLDVIVGKQKERALLLLDDLAHSWLFRPGDDPVAGRSLEYRTMSCSFDPNAEVPPEVYAEPGVRVQRSR